MNAATRVTGNNGTVTGAMRPGRRSAIAFVEALSPLGFRGGLSNLSDYVGDNPTNTTDPSGMEPPDQVAKQKADEEAKMQQKVDAALKLLLDNSKKARDLFEEIQKKESEQIHVVVDKDVRSGAATSPNYILINPTAKEFQGDNGEVVMASVILFELLNLKSNFLFRDVRKELAAKGALSRIDYVVAIERIEYGTTLRHHEYSQDLLKNLPKEKKEQFAKFDRYAAMFDKDDKPWSLDSSLLETAKNDPEHMKTYARAWNDTYYGAWKDTPHGKEDPDKPFDDSTKGLQYRTVEAIQKVLATVPLPPEKKKMP